MLFKTKFISFFLILLCILIMGTTETNTDYGEYRGNITHEFDIEFDERYGNTKFNEFNGNTEPNEFIASNQPDKFIKSTDFDEFNENAESHEFKGKRSGMISA